MLHLSRIVNSICHSEVFIYLPWIGLTVLGYYYTGSLLSVAILICLWKCLGYFWTVLIAKINIRCLRRLLIIFLVVNTIYYILSASIGCVIVSIYCYSISDTLYREEFRDKSTSKYTKIIGMVLIGVVSYFQDLLYLITTFLALYQLYAITPPEKAVSLTQASANNPIDTRYLFIEFLHNYIYYLVFAYIPLIEEMCLGVQSPLCAAVCCFANWIFFVKKDTVIELLCIWRGITQLNIISVGFLISAIMFIAIGASTNLWVVLILLLIQGVSGGVSEAFWSKMYRNYSDSRYTLFWKTGGILGCLSGGIITYCFGIRSVFILSGIISALVSLFVAHWNLQEVRYGNHRIK